VRRVNVLGGLVGVAKAWPTAQTVPPDTAVTALGWLLPVTRLGVLTTLHAEPFHCSVSAEASCPSLPTFQISLDELTAMATSELRSVPAFGLETIVHVAAAPAGPS
jgi:hypothetical protein